MSKYSEYEYRNQPGFDMNSSEGAYQAIPMETLVIYCFDPAQPKSRRRSLRILGMEFTGRKHSRRKWQSSWIHANTVCRDQCGWTRRVRLSRVLKK